LKVVLLFVDGLGIGRENSDTNPCTQDETGIFQVFVEKPQTTLPFSGISTGLDANLGVPGLPQSATGQTALLTGFNASQYIGHHLSGFPNKKLRELLLSHSVLLNAVQLGKEAAFINAFRPRFFELPEHLILRLSATTIANYAAKLPFFKLEDITAQRSIYQDFTNVSLLERGFEVSLFTPEEAAEILAVSVDSYDFILYEYFLTDKAGHSQEMEVAQEEIFKLGRFVFRFLENIDLQNTLVILTSDHGNIEDLSTKSHTRNPAMTLVWGRNNQTVVDNLGSIVEVTPTILHLLQNS
jgi:2,3-bisphosphoglycerate-independent phosphoglycerate mutase